ncbi:uncharacterized, partial [Tachysurus ichikawai]
TPQSWMVQFVDVLLGAVLLGWLESLPAAGMKTCRSSTVSPTFVTAIIVLCPTTCTPGPEKI